LIWPSGRRSSWAAAARRSSTAVPATRCGLPTSSRQAAVSGWPWAEAAHGVRTPANPSRGSASARAWRSGKTDRRR
jgi:hypothetical protein